jgi:hypothetical protein
MFRRTDFTTPIKIEEKLLLPKVWLVVFGLVGAGILLHLILWIAGVSGLLIWPFIWAVCVLLVVSDAADSHGAGVAPVVAYTCFLGTLLGFFIFVILISKTINPYLLAVLLIAAGVYIAKDWKRRKAREREIDRRRAAQLCLRCCEPVSNGIEDICEHCGLPVNPERMNLFRLGKAITNQSRQGHLRQTLTGSKPTRADVKFQAKQQDKAASYKRKK